MAPKKGIKKKSVKEPDQNEHDETDQFSPEELAMAPSGTRYWKPSKFFAPFTSRKEDLSTPPDPNEALVFSHEPINFSDYNPPYNYPYPMNEILTKHKPLDFLIKSSINDKEGIATHRESLLRQIKSTELHGRFEDCNILDTPFPTSTLYAIIDNYYQGSYIFDDEDSEFQFS